MSPPFALPKPNHTPLGTSFSSVIVLGIKSLTIEWPWAVFKGNNIGLFNEELAHIKVLHPEFSARILESIDTEFN